jgi:hypothetical protein
MDAQSPILVATNAETYAQDLYAWCFATAALVRKGHWDAIDREALIEELESLGKSQYRELESRLEVLVLHLLKWQYAPVMGPRRQELAQRRTSRSWASTIVEQRTRLAGLLRDNPSLRPQVPRILEDIYPKARAQAELALASSQTTLSPRDLIRYSRLPMPCPWTEAQVCDDDFWPGESL